MESSGMEYTLEEYRQIETRMHLELTNVCRKYISRLGIVSIMGILDIVKQEAIDLERATKQNLRKDEFDDNKTGEFKID